MVAEFCRQFNLSMTEEQPRLNVSAAAVEKVKPVLTEKKFHLRRGS
jgi:hypothetical protein